MSKRTFVCFACRTTERVLITRVTRNCRKCHAPAEHVYYKFRIPPVDDDKGWADLEQKVRTVNRTIKDSALRRLQAQVERYSRTLKAPSTNKRKTALTKARLREAEEKIRKYERWR